MISINKNFIVSVILLLSVLHQSTQSDFLRNRKVVKKWQPFIPAEKLIKRNYEFNSEGNLISNRQGYNNNVQTTNSNNNYGQTTASQNNFNGYITSSQAQNENLITGIQFDCNGKPTGPNQDPNYCDIFHACVYGQLQKTYSCPQVGVRFYYNPSTQRCEFSSQNPQGCPSNNYYQPLINPQPANNNYAPSVTNPPSYPSQPIVTNPPSYPSQPIVTNPPSYPSQPTFQNPTVTQFNYGNNGGNNNNNQIEPWRQYVQQNEQFSCSGRQDGFYPSANWCNVFYRCFNGIKYEFLCAKQTNGDRLWWLQHSTSQVLPQPTAQCGFPCTIGRQCTSPGGVLIDNGASVTQSTADASRIINSCAAQQQGAVGQTEDISNDQFRLPDADNNCVGVPDGTKIESKYCNVFHVCIANKRKDLRCAKGSQNPDYDLWYDPAQQRCEYPCKLSCSKQIFGSQQSGAQISQLDSQVHVALCSAGSNNQYGNNNLPNPITNSPSPYQTQPPAPVTYPTQPPAPVTYPSQPPAPVTYPTQPPAPVTYPTQPPAPVTYPTQPPSPITFPTQPPAPITYPTQSYNNNNNNNNFGYGR